MKIFGPEARGSVGAVTTSRNTFALYQRQRSGRGGTPVLPLTSAVAAWQALTADQQEAWNRWALLVGGVNTLGISRPLTGVARFVSAWKLALPFGGTVTDAPVRRSSSYLTGASISTIAAATVQVLGDYVVPAGETGNIQISMNVPAASTGTLSPPGRGSAWKFIGGVGGISPGSGSTGNNFVFLSAGRVFGRARMIGDDWVPGPWLRAPGFEVVP